MYEYNANGQVKVISIFYFLSLRNLKDMPFRKLTVFLLAVFSCFEGAARIDVGRFFGLPVSRLSYHIQTSLCIRIPCDCRTIASPLRWHHPRLWSAIKSGINIVRTLEFACAICIINVGKRYIIRESRKARPRNSPVGSPIPSFIR